MDYSHPEYLIDPQTLQTQLARDKFRVFDAGVFLTPSGNGQYQVESGLNRYQQAHIPGAGFIDLIEAWATPSPGLNFTLPPLISLCEAIGASGISNDHTVVLYSSGHLMWATRAWWLLHYAGHNDVKILQGNLSGWKQANLPLVSGTENYPRSQFSALPRTGAFADTNEVEAGMHGKVCTVNALTQSLYEGSGDFYYQRRGHIPGSHLLFYDSLLDNECFLPAPQLADALNKLGILDADRVITYCGGGIAATLDAFAAKLLGQDNVGVYDGSMSEWVQDENRPLTEGPQP